MLQNRNKHIALILLSIVYICFVSIYIINTRVFGDGGFHADYVVGFFNKGHVDGLSSQLWGTYGFPRFQQYGLNYPALYHVLGVILYPFMGIKWVLVVDAILVFVIGLTGYAFTYRIRGSSAYASLIYVMLIFSGLSIPAGNNNLYNALYILLSYIVLFMFYKYNDKKYLYLLVIFAVGGFGSKQFYIFVVPFLILILIYFFLKKNISFKTLVLTIVSTAILITPIITFQIYTTGTISTQTIEGWPVIDKVLSPRHVKDIETWQHDLDEDVNIETLRRMSETHYNAVNTPVISSLINSPEGTLSRWFDLNNYSILPLSLRSALLNGVFLILISLSILSFCKQYRQSTKYLFLITSILIPFLIIMLFTRRIEYALFLPIMTVFFIGAFLPKLPKRIGIIVIAMISLLYISNAYLYGKNAVYFSNNNYMRSNVSNNEIETMYSWITDNVDKQDKILSSNTQDDPLYTGKVYFYDYRLWFLNNKQLKEYVPKYTGFKYVLLFKPNIQQDFNNWNIIPNNSPLLHILNTNSSAATKKYESKNFVIYEINNEKF